MPLSYLSCQRDQYSALKIESTVNEMYIFYVFVSFTVKFILWFTYLFFQLQLMFENRKWQIICQYGVTKLPPLTLVEQQN